ncbi:hypothetical protein ANRL2_02579 [Anaerolineae bacterium]|nr:hypothetical protein ANRL2_02579 [Anaerolineae bacterium]
MAGVSPGGAPGRPLARRAHHQERMSNAPAYGLPISAGAILTGCLSGHDSLEGAAVVDNL